MEAVDWGFKPRCGPWRTRPGGRFSIQLKRQSLSAGDLAARFPISGAAVSKHLAVLKEAGLIRDRREGKYIFYELNASVLEEVLLWLNGLKED